MNPNISSNSTDNVINHTTEAFVIVTSGLICTIGNFSCILLIVCHRRFRKTTVVILCHHCCLDLMKSLYCFPYGYSLMTSLPAPYCNLIGSSYVFIVTTSAYNMMALVVNQDYELMFTTPNRPHDSNCVVFGIFIIWFMSFLLNLGISIIPSNTEFNSDIGICLFLYGHSYSYIVHVLWISLVSIAILLSLMFFCRMRRNVKNDINRYKWKQIHESLNEEFQNMLDFNIQDGEQENNVKSRRSTIHSQLRTTKILMSIVISFAVFWYPLFLLTLFDFHFNVTPLVYRILTIIALSHPITTPVFCSLILRDIKFKGYTLRDISSNLMPLQRISSRRSHYENRNAYNFDCKSHLDTDLDGIQIQSNTEQNYDGETGFINQRFIENDSSRKVMSTV